MYIKNRIVPIPPLAPLCGVFPIQSQILQLSPSVCSRVKETLPYVIEEIKQNAYTS
jgi:hypothetical protein